MDSIADRLADIRDKVAEASHRVSRQSQEVTILAATKTRTVPEIIEAVAAGITHLGENYVQELLAKKERLDQAGYTQVAWHVIGHLQTNKVKYVAPFCTLIQSVDSRRVAEEINKRAARIGRVQPVLIEVNVSGESSKFGVAPPQVAELAVRLGELAHIELQGLMTMPPYSDDPEDSRPHFQALSRLAVQFVDSGGPVEAMRQLSMGMSGDYEVAVEEGATIIRLGTVLFGPRGE